MHIIAVKLVFQRFLLEMMPIGLTDANIGALLACILRILGHLLMSPYGINLTMVLMVLLCAAALRSFGGTRRQLEAAPLAVLSGGKTGSS